MSAEQPIEANGIIACPKCLPHLQPLYMNPIYPNILACDIHGPIHYQSLWLKHEGAKHTKDETDEPPPTD